MITTSGYGPGSVEFANGKPLHLIDGTGLLSICQENGIPARILDLGKRKPSKPLPRNSRLDDHVDCCFWLEFGQL